MDFKALLIKQAAIYNSKPAIIFEGQPLSFSALARGSFQVSNYLAQNDIVSGDKVAIYLPNIPEAALAFFGIFSLGAVAVPLDFMLTQQELIHILNHSEAKVLIAFPKNEVDLEEIKKACPRLKQVITCRQKVSGCRLWEEAVARAWDKPPDFVYHCEALAAIFYTSGSTGQPKGVMLSYANLVNPGKNIKNY